MRHLNLAELSSCNYLHPQPLMDLYSLDSRHGYAFLEELGETSRTDFTVVSHRSIRDLVDNSLIQELCATIAELVLEKSSRKEMVSLTSRFSPLPH